MVFTRTEQSLVWKLPFSWDAIITFRPSRLKINRNSSVQKKKGEVVGSHQKLMSFKLSSPRFGICAPSFSGILKGDV